MVDAALAARSPLAGLAHPGDLAIAEIPAAIVSLAVRREGLPGLRDAVRSGWDVELPTTPRRVVAGDVAFVWAGPGKFLVVAEGQSEIAPFWQDRVNKFAAVVELGDGRCIFRVSGTNVRRAMARLVAIDLHPRAFSPGHVAMTLAGHIAVHLWQRDDTPSYDIVVARSMAQSLHHDLSKM